MKYGKLTKKYILLKISGGKILKMVARSGGFLEQFGEPSIMAKTNNEMITHLAKMEDVRMFMQVLTGRISRGRRRERPQMKKKL